MRTLLGLLVTLILAGRGGSGKSPLACSSTGPNATCDETLGCTVDGCNWCSCHGNEAGTCTQVGCVRQSGDTFGQPCAGPQDCSSGERCVHNPGCGDTTGVCSVGGCGKPFGTTNSQTICDCNGKTTTLDVYCGVEQPYAHVGACG